MYKKDFDGWNDIKKSIDSGKKNLLYKERDIWWCSLGLNVGFEQDGSGDAHRRPVLVIKGLGPKICLVVPLTSSINQHRMRIPIGIVDGKPASVILSQIRTVDTKRFIGKVCRLNEAAFSAIRKAVRDLF